MNEMTQIDLKEIFMALLRKWWLLLLCAILAASIAFVYTAKFVKPMYRATVSMYVNNNSTSKPQGSGISASDLATSQRLVTTYIAILKSNTVLEKVAAESETRYTPSAIRSMMSSSSVNETEVFEVSISHPDPAMAEKLANAVATVAETEISNIVEGSSTKIIDHANVPTRPYTPNYTRNVMLGGGVGLLVSAILISLLTILDVRIKGEEDIARVSEAPVLGKIPNFNTSRDDDYAYTTEDGLNRKAVQ